jgi:hypothetical protein
MPPMMKENDCWQNAVETVELANKASSSEDKARLLALAEKWLDLADRVRWSARNRLATPQDLHPLVRSKIPDPGQRRERD